MVSFSFSTSVVFDVSSRINRQRAQDTLAVSGVQNVFALWRIEQGGEISSRCQGFSNLFALYLIRFVSQVVTCGSSETKRQCKNSL